MRRVHFAVITFYVNGYSRFFRPFYESCRRNFFPGWTKRFVIFTDNPFIQGDDIVNLPISHEDYGNWRRAGYVAECATILETCDHAVVVNGNAFFLAQMDERRDPGFVAPLFGSTTGLSHQSYHRVESNRKSRAFIDHDLEDISVYWRGGLWGGSSAQVVGAAREINTMMWADGGAGRDERYINRYFVTHKDEATVLDARYVWSGAWGYNPHFDIRIVMADKEGRYQELFMPLSREQMRRFAGEAWAEEPFYLGPGLWPSSAVPLARTPPKQMVDRDKLAWSRRLYEVAHSVGHMFLPPILTKGMQWAVRKRKEVRRRRLMETATGGTP